MVPIKKLGKVWVYLTPAHGKTFFSNMKKDFQAIPAVVKILIINMSLLRFGRGIGINMYYSLFLKTLFDNLFIVSALGSLLALTKLFFSIPIWVLDNKINSKTILIVGKMMFVIAGLMYFAAGLFGVPWLMVFAILVHGLATPMVFNTNQFLLRRLVPVHLSSKSFGMFFSTYQFGYLLAALVTAVIMKFDLPLPYFFLIGSIVTVFTLISNTKNKIVDKHGLLYEVKKEVLNLHIFKDVVYNLKKHKNGLWIMLFLQALHGLLYYLWFMFIPILAVAKDFTLIQVALLFAVMRIPHALTFYFESMISMKKELKFTLWSLFIIAALVALIAVSNSFTVMLIISFVMSFFIATTRPILAGMVTRLISVKEQAEITGVQDFVNRAGEILGYLIFGIIAQYINIEIAFVWVAIGTFMMSLYALKTRKRIRFNKVTEK